jgi:hypothetical protein
MMRRRKEGREGKRRIEREGSEALYLGAPDGQRKSFVCVNKGHHLSPSSFWTKDAFMPTNVEC